MPFNHPTSPLSPVPSISSPPIFSSPSPPPQPPPSVDGTRRRSPLSDAEKLDKVFECLRTDVYWSVSDFLRVLTAAEGPVNIRRKTAFAAAAYQDSNVLGLYFDDEDRPWNGVRQSVIQALDLGNNELRNEVRRLGDMAPFSKNPSDRGGSYEKLDMSRVVDTSQKQAPILLQILRRIMAPELRRLYQRQNGGTLNTNNRVKSAKLSDFGQHDWIKSCGTTQPGHRPVDQVSKQRQSTV